MKVIYERDLEGSLRVGRGGSWGFSAQVCLAAYRTSDDAGNRNYGLAIRLDDLGFRPIIRIKGRRLE